LKTRQFDIITIFPGMFEFPFSESILKRAQDQELLNINLHDLRKYTLDKHRKTDDYPFGVYQAYIYANRGGLCSTTPGLARA
jgi:tRNA (guanine37-N1)-methyltransferase